MTTRARVRWVIGAFLAAGFALAGREANSEQPRAPRAFTIQALGRCLDVAGGVSADGTNVQLHTCNGTPAQQWVVRGNQLVALGRCLDVQGGIGRDGQNVQLYQCNGTIAQQWTIRGTTIQSVLGRCLDVDGGQSADGQNVQLYQCNGTPAQTWQLVPSP